MYTPSLILMFLSLLLSTAAAQNWPQWRGEHRDGAISGTVFPKVWPDSLLPVWKHEVGTGYASPIVVQGKIYLQTRLDGAEVISCRELESGREIWKHTNKATFEKNKYAVDESDGPFSTPTFYQGRIYALGVNGLLTCLNAENGELLWQRSFTNEVDTSRLFCGTAMSPLVANGLCIVHVGDDSQGALLGYDAASGDVKWQLAGHGPGYASPISVTIDDVWQIVTLTDKGAIGVAARTGTLLWQIPFEDEWNENIITPLSSGNRIIFSGVRNGTLAVKVGRSGDKWSVTEIWRNKAFPMYMSSPVMVGNRLLGFTSKMKGQFFLMDPETGEVAWSGEGRQGRHASLVRDSQQIVALTNDGTLLVYEKSGETLELIKRYESGERETWAYPILMRNRILLKGENTLSLWKTEG